MSHLLANYTQKKETATPSDLIQAFTHIPHDATSLDLSETQIFYKLSIFQLQEIFGKLSKIITSLDFGKNNLGLMPGSRVFNKALACIPSQITALSLRDNGIGDGIYKGPELAMIFKKIPISITSLDLSENWIDFDPLSADIAQQIFNNIPSNVIALNLSRNNLGRSPELVQSFVSLPKSLISLNLSENYLSLKNSAELAQAFAGIPKNITSLNLSRNKMFDTKTGTELKQFIDNLPKTITSIAFENDQFIERETAKILFATNFNGHLKQISNKLTKYSHSKRTDHKNACIAVQLLLTDLKLAQTNFIQSPESILTKAPVFKTACLNAINKSEEVLSQHRGWKPILAALTSAIVSILSLGMANLASGRSIFGLFPTHTDSMKKLETLTSVLNSEIKAQAT